MSEEPPSAPAEAASQSAAKTRVFISYARRDSAFADMIERVLSSSGLTTWMDRQRLAGGADWPVGLREAIEACDALLVILSPHSLASAAVQREYQYALSINKRVIPLLYRKIKAPPAELAHINWVDCTREIGIYDLLFTLYDAGLVSLSVGKVEFNPSLVIALALHRATPANWRVAQVDRLTYRNQWLRYSLFALAPLILYILLLLALNLSDKAYLWLDNLLLADNLPWEPPIIVGAVSTALLVIAAAIDLRLLFRAWFYRDLYQGKRIQELLVVTPMGVVRRRIQRPATLYCIFAWTQRLDRTENRRGDQKITITFLPRYARQATAPILMISHHFATAKPLGVEIMARFWQYCARQQPEVKPVGDQAFTSVRRGALPAPQAPAANHS